MRTPFRAIVLAVVFGIPVVDVDAGHGLPVKSLIDRSSLCGDLEEGASRWVSTG